MYVKRVIWLSAYHGKNNRVLWGRDKNFQVSVMYELLNVKLQNQNFIYEGFLLFTF
jgi:hypothetical protein